MAEHFCSDGGYVVAADLIVPDDPSDYPTGASILGCNRLRCPRCGEMVSQRPIGLGRLYACRCLEWLETSWHACQKPDPEPVSTGPSLPWACAGHPASSLPLVVDGERIDATTDLDALAGRVLAGWSPDTGPPPTSWSPTAWLHRVRSRLTGLPQTAVLALAVARRLDDPEARGGAIAYFCGFPRDPGFEAIVARAEDPAWLHTRSPDRPKQGPSYRYWPGWAVRCRLFSVRGEPDALDREALRILQESALRGDPGLEREDLDAIELIDAPWLAAHAAGIARADRARTIQVLECLRERSDPALIVIAGVALAGEPAADHDAMREWLGHWSNRNEPYAVVIAHSLEKR